MLQLIIDLLPTRIFWKDKELKYLGCNLAFAKDAGKKRPAELIGKDDYMMVWKEQAESYREDDKKVIETGASRVNYEEPQTTPDGKKIWLLTTKLPMKDEKGQIIGILGTYADITERKSAQDELKKQMAELELFRKASVDRELKMVELKRRIAELEKHEK